MTTTTTTSGAADLLDLIEAYAEARHRQGHCSYNAQTAAALQAVKDALAAGQATAAQAVVPAGPTPQADSVLYDPKAVLDVFNSARAGSEKPVGYLRGILAVIAHLESRPEPHRWMVPAQPDSVLEDAARLDHLHSTGSTIELLPGEVDFYPMRFRVGGLRSAVSPNLREAIDIARKQGGA